MNQLKTELEASNRSIAISGEQRDLAVTKTAQQQQSRLHQLEMDLTESRLTVGNLEKKCAELQSLLSQSQSGRSSSTDELHRALDEQRQQCKQHCLLVQQWRQKHADLETMFQTSERERLHLRQQYLSLGDRLQRALADEERSHQHLAQTHQSQVQQLQDRLNASQSELTEANRRLQSVQSDLDRRSVDAERRISEEQQLRSRAERQLHDVQLSQQQMSQTLIELRTRCESLQSLQTSSQAQTIAAQNDLEAAKVQVQHQLLQQQQRHDTELSQLQAKHQNEITALRQQCDDSLKVRDEQLQEMRRQILMSRVEDERRQLQQQERFNDEIAKCKVDRDQFDAQLQGMVNFE